MNREHGGESAGGSALTDFREIALGAVVGLLLSLLLLLALAALLSTGTLDEDQAGLGVCAAAGLGTMLGALTAARRVSKRRLLGALLSGAILYLLIVVVGTLFDLRGSGGWKLPLTVLAAALAGGLLGGSGRRRRRIYTGGRRGGHNGNRVT